jgi:hypothetical protein
VFSQYRDICNDRMDCTSLHKKDSVTLTALAVEVSNQSVTEEETWMLLNLNGFLRPQYLGKDVGRGLKDSGTVIRDALDAEFYITKLPEVGQMFQAYRPSDLDCASTYPQSCDSRCCTTRPRTVTMDNGQFLKTCCLARADELFGGQRLFLIGDEITAVPAKV